MITDNAARVPHKLKAKVPLQKNYCAARMPHMSDALYARIKMRLDELGISQRKASMMVAGNADVIRNIKRGRSENLRGPRLLKLATVLKVSPEWLNNEKDHASSEQIAGAMTAGEQRETNGATSLQHYQSELPGAVPEIDARAGAGQSSVGEHEAVPFSTSESYVGHRITAEWVFPPSFLRNELHVQPGGIVVLEVVGDSMSPTLKSGDRVIIDTSHARPVPDGIYVVDEGDGPLVKRIQLVRRSDPQEVRVISDNKNHDPYTLRLDDVRIIGRVSGRITRM